MSAFPKTINEIPEGFFESIESLDPNRKKPSASVSNPALINSSDKKYEYLLAGDIASAGFTDESAADQSITSWLARKGFNREMVELIWKKSLPREKLNLLVRPMESGVWPLDDPLFLRSSIGRVTFLDTGGFFNPAEDGNDYKQALQFAKLVFEAITAGCLGVIPLFHLAKGVKKEDWSLENSIIGSAGYGAMLRSCLRVFNLNPDLNDPKVHLYLQGMKNPGLKPFQLTGPAPFEMKVKPGESPYLKVLLSGDAKYVQACELFEKKVTQREVAEQLSLSLGKVNKMHQRWEGKTDAEEDDGPAY